MAITMKCLDDGFEQRMVEALGQRMAMDDLDFHLPEANASSRSGVPLLAQITRWVRENAM
jgi:hypothetical protein